MKNFSELSKKELANLTEIQLEAYIDIELANRGVVKSVNIPTDYPDFIKPISLEPERDLTIYSVNNYNFTDQETAENFSKFLGKLTQLRVDYDYSVGSEFKYASEKLISSPQINISKVYSQPKYEAIKTQLIQVKKEREKNRANQEEQVESAIDYEAIDKIKEQLREKVREAIDFFYKAEKYAGNFEKYFAITEDEDKALQTIFTTFNIQDEETKEEIKKLVSEGKLIKLPS